MKKQFGTAISKRVKAAPQSSTSVHNNAAQNMLVYNMLPRALGLNTIESRGKQCSECAIHNLVTIVEVNN